MDPDRLAHIPLFPLPRVVLLPGTLLPLHVFEQRYRALVADCLAADRILGIATPDPAQSAPPGKRSPLFPEVGIGRIVQHQAFRDGRSNIVVEAVGRAFLVAEEDPPTRAYRIASAREYPTRDPRGAGVERLRMLAIQLGAFSLNAREEIRRMVALDDLALVDALAARVLDDPDQRRAYLGRARFHDQVRDVERRLAELLTVGDPSAEA